MNEFEARTEQKLKSINANSAVGAITQFIAARPLGSRNKDLVRRDL